MLKTTKDPVWVSHALKKKFLQKKLDFNFKNLDSLISDMFDKCYPECKK